MENVSKFSPAAFSRGIVKSGAKVSGASRAEISLDSTYNKFTINARARKMMDIKDGDYIVFIDMAASAQNRAERFFVTKGWKNPKGQYEGAKVGEVNSFNYSVIYAVILNHAINDPADLSAMEITEIKPRELAGNGTLVARTHKNGNTTYVSTKKVFMEVVPFSGGDPVPIDEENGIYQPVFQLTNWLVENHNPKEEGEETPLRDITEEYAAMEQAPEVEFEAEDEPQVQAESGLV